MILSVRRMISLMKYIIAFIVLSVIFYYIISYMVTWVQPVDPYKEPMGRAVKVVKYEHTQFIKDWDWLDRLKLFYWFGE